MRAGPSFGVEADDDYERRRGTHQTEIVKVELFNAQGKAPTHFSMSAFFKLRIHYIVHQRINTPAWISYVPALLGVDESRAYVLL